MTQDSVLQILRDAMTLTFKLAGPLLIISMIVGLVIAIIQAATQVHEQTLTFVPKVLTIILLLFVMASFIMGQMDSFVAEIFEVIEQISTHTVT
ncbi:MAG: flagellar biosynthesis protein FliQ [Ruminococcus sp.]|nr:flagellar biosynthesis protein FliQ [Ruminococcus sp.]